MTADSNKVYVDASVLLDDGNGELVGWVPARSGKAKKVLFGSSRQPYYPESQGYPVSGPGGYPVQGAYPPPRPPPQGGYYYGPPPQSGYQGYPQQSYYNGQPPPQAAQRSGPYRSGRRDSSEDANSDSDFTGFSDGEIRNTFIKKVYTILCVQLAITAAIVCPFLYVDDVQEFVDDYPFLIYIALIAYIVVLIPLVCCESVRRSFPINFIFLFLLTIALGILCGFISSQFNTEIVLITFGMTALICLIVTLIACFAPIDITGCGCLLCILTLCLMIFGLISTMLVVFLQMKILILVYSGLAVALFSLYLIYDTQQIMGGKRIELSPEEYILGALQLYIDVIMIFLNLLPLVAACFGGGGD